MTEVTNFLKAQKDNFIFEDTDCIIKPVESQLRKDNMDLLQEELLFDIFKDDKGVGLITCWNDNTTTVYSFDSESDIQVDSLEKLEKILRALG